MGNQVREIPSNVIVPKDAPKIVPRTPVTKNCTQENKRGLTRLPLWSKIIMWKANKTEQTSRSKSPIDTAPKPFAKERK